VNYNKVKISILILVILAALLYLISQNTSIFKFTSQDKLLGKWGGLLNGRTHNVMVFTIIKKDSTGKITGKISHPKKYDLFSDIDSLIVNDDSLEFFVKKYKVHFRGKFLEDSNKIVGLWQQPGFKRRFVFFPNDELYRVNRPQHPFKPFPYASDSVEFYNTSDSTLLAGTITYPKNESRKFPAVLLLSGLGPHDRDATMYFHKPFLVISDFLTRNGFAVFRFDERGVGKSSGDFNAAKREDLIEDAYAALEFLKKQSFVDSTRTGILGFSEGSIIGAKLSDMDKNVKFLIMLSAPAKPGDSILVNQTKRMGEKLNIPPKEIRKDLEFNKKMLDVITTVKDTSVMRKKLIALFNKQMKEMPEKERARRRFNLRAFNKQLDYMLTPWFLAYLKEDPRDYYAKVRCPVLALYGENDFQIDPVSNKNLLNEILKQAGNKNVKNIILKEMNHLFQESNTGLPAEYKKNKQTFSKEALKIILDWLNQTLDSSYENV